MTRVYITYRIKKIFCSLYFWPVISDFFFLAYPHIVIGTLSTPKLLKSHETLFNKRHIMRNIFDKRYIHSCFKFLSLVV